MPRSQTIKQRAALEPARQRRSISRAQVLDNARIATQGRKPGRPLTYDPQLGERAVTLGNKGFSIADIATAFGISKKTLYEWERDYSEFSDCLARARTASQAWWERKAQQSLGKKHFQANLWRYSMAGRFKEDYAEKPQATASELVDFLSAVVDAAGERQTKRIQPGDGAKPIEPLDVAVSSHPHEATKGPKR